MHHGISVSYILYLPKMLRNAEPFWTSTPVKHNPERRSAESRLSSEFTTAKKATF